MGEKILIVDDQAGIRRLLYEAFNEQGYEVELAGNGMEALEKVKAASPDLILLDMKMPGMSGIETLKEIKTIDPSALVVMMTAYGELEIVAEALKLGIKEYVAKPFDINELRGMIRTILNERPQREAG